MQVFFLADLNNGLKGSSQITTIVAENRSSHPYLRMAQRRLMICAEVMIEAPLVHLGAQG